MNIREVLRLYFVMGNTNCIQEPIVVLEQAIEGGITLFQFREKGEGALEGEAKYHFAKDLQQVCKRQGIPFIVNDDVELALQLNADGIHIGQEDGDAHSVRKSIGNRLLGVSCHNLQEAQEAIKNGADYIGVGPMYPTLSKLDTRDVIGPELITQLREAGISIPVVGIGGITSENARHVIEAGADGIAVISAISKNTSPKVAAEKFIHLL